MASDIVIAGVTFPTVPYMNFKDTGGNSHQFTDTSPTTATASDVAQGKQFFDASGTLTTGTASGGDGSTTLVLGAIRPDAELVQRWAYDKLAVEDEGLNIPTYTASATTLKAQQSLGTGNTNTTAYDYFLQVRLLAYPIYQSGTGYSAGRCEMFLGAASYDVVHVPANTIKASNGTSYATNIYTLKTSLYDQRLVYWKSATALNVATNQYGTFMDFGSYSATATGFTLKGPALKMRGSTSSFTQTYWQAVSDIRYQYVVELYRAPKGNLNLDGWGLQQQLLRAADCYANGGTLT